MTTRTTTFPLRLPVSLKSALESMSKRDGTSMNQFLVIAAAEKIAAQQTEDFFAERKVRARSKEISPDPQSKRRRSPAPRR